ncbi:MAG: hypothetical protein U0V02_09315 [Anaerolineales bacterium]
MGNGNYSQAAHEALLRGRTNIPAQQVFKQSKCHPLMNPKGVRLRESRDGSDHPQSLGIVFALDVTGSMGEIPRLMATKQLPVFMKTLMDCKIDDPQLLFMAVGDAVSDSAPLQVGQFESTAELMDQWLTWSYLEGGGGGTGQESYELGLYFLAMHSEMDCMTKRNKRGYLFMTGDEVPYPTLSKHVVEAVIGDRLDEDLTCEEVVAELQKSFVPFFIIPDRTRAKRCERRWRDLFGDHVLCLQSPSDVCFVTAGAILLSEGRVSSLRELASLLKNAGMPSSRHSYVIQSLTPFAEVALKSSDNWLSHFIGQIRRGRN